MAAADLGSLVLTPPPEWKSLGPKPPMRKAQFVLPRVKNDTADGEFVVFYFGAQQGGSADANIARWLDSFERPPEISEADYARRTNKIVDGMKVTTLEIQGNYFETTFGPGNSSQRAKQGKTGYRLLAAVVETPEGSYFLKSTGPNETMMHWREAWNRMIDGLRRRAREKDEDKKATGDAAKS